MTSSWTGWIVPRVLPKVIPVNDSDNNNNSNNNNNNISGKGTTTTSDKVSKRRISPELLCPRTGIHYHPFAVADGPLLQQSRISDSNLLGEQVAGENTKNAAAQQPPSQDPTLMKDSWSTILDVYVLPSGMSPEHAALWDNTNNNATTNNKNDADPFLHVQLNRHSQDLVNQTLERMVISLNKQIKKKQKRKKEKQQSKGKQQQKAADDKKDTSPVSIYKLTEEQSNTTAPNIIATLKSNQQWDVDALTNQQVWQEALTTPLLVDLQLMDNITLSLRVDACPPTIQSVDAFEDFSSKVFCEVPLVVQVETMFSSHAVVDWYIGNALVCPGSLSYTPQTSDIGKQVSVLITPRRTGEEGNHHSGQGYEESYRFQNVVEALPTNTVVKLRAHDDSYEWINPQRRKSQGSPSSSLSESTTIKTQPLRVATFNILADQNAYKRNTPGSKQIPCYPYVSSSVLDKKRRMPLILHEILAYEADVICLQEVDEGVWQRLFYPALKQAGYQGYFSVKSAKGTSEGCAMLWSLHRFEELPEEDMKQYGLSELVVDIADNHSSMSKEWKSATSIATVLQERPDLKSVIENKLGHVVQMVSLALRNDQASASVPDRLLVANTHLFYHPLAAHIRLLQMYAISRQFEQFQQGEQQQPAASYPMILCGDMNSSLRRAAGYLLIQREVKPDHAQIRDHFNRFQWQDRKKKMVASVGGPSASNIIANKQKGGIIARVEHSEEDRENEDHWEDFPTIELPDHFPSFLTGYPTEPAFTHYLDMFVGSLDHIFISQCSERNLYGLAPHKSAPMPSVEQVTEQVAMPSENLPSDHVSLVSDLHFTKHS